LALDPDFIVADEIVSGLDVSTQAYILLLLRELRARLRLTMVSSATICPWSACSATTLRSCTMARSSNTDRSPDLRLPAACLHATAALCDPITDVERGWLDDPSRLCLPTSKDQPHDRDIKVLSSHHGGTGAIAQALIAGLAARGAAKIYAAARTFPSSPHRPTVPIKMDVTSDEDVAKAARLRPISRS